MPNLEKETPMKNEIIESIRARKTRSAWDRGVQAYAIELLEDLEGEEITREALLNGASDWSEYSQGGCALIYDADIAERLCSPSELRKTRGGERNPNRRETWLDVQARALSQAFRLINREKEHMERELAIA